MLVVRQRIDVRTRENFQCHIYHRSKKAASADQTGKITKHSVSLDGVSVTRVTFGAAPDPKT
jgi:hypothetical protein